MTTDTGYTRARSMGRIADAVRLAGGSVERVFHRAGLSMRLLEHPDQVILLRDQLAMVEFAAQEIGDDALAPRLSLRSGFRHLGPLAEHIASAPTLETAIRRCNAGIGPLLQSATHLDLSLADGLAVWTYRISDPAAVGRRRNEALALGYMLDMIRLFAGRGAVPLRAILPEPIPARERIEELLGCDVIRGSGAALVFAADRLVLRNPAVARIAGPPIDPVPDASDLVAGVTQLMRLGILDRRPTIDWMARRLGLPRRTLQRRLGAQGTSFERLLDLELRERAAKLLRDARLPLSQVALELGYSDPAHFTRASTRWSGLAPRDWRRRLREQPG